MNKKIKSISAFLLCCILSVTAFAGCGGNSTSCSHDVSKWTVVTPATCNSQGLEEGICSLCLKTIYRTIDIDEDAHEYGDWQITAYPTETRTGTAIKTCKLNTAHQYRISLPALNSDDYTSSVTTRPSATASGVRTYVLAHELGDVTFTVEISNTGITSVRDAVEVCTASESHDLVRSGTGTVSNSYYSGLTASSSSSYSFFYEYGEGYTHIDDVKYDRKERWYSYDEDGNVIGYCQDSASGSEAFYEETKTTAGASEYINGYRYVFTYATYMGTYYGTENFIAGLYAAARQNINNDFSESTYVNGDGETVYTFTYGLASYTSDGGYFSIVTAEFTITSEYTIKWFDVECVSYVNSEDVETESWATDEDGYAYVKYETGMRYVAEFSVEQVTKTEDPVEPVNPYSVEETHVTSFDITYQGETISDDGYINGEAIDITATVSTTTSGSNDFEITNVVPSSMSGSLSSEISFYYRQYTNDDKTEYEDVEINSMTGGYTNVGIIVYFSSSTKTFYIKSNIAGEIDIVVKTSRAEQIIHFNVSEVAPSTLYPRVYKYSVSGYSWNRSTTTRAAESVYIGQPLYFSTYVADSEARYASTSYTATVTSATDAAGNAITDGYTLTLDSMFNSQSMSAFTATQAGTYVITLSSALNSSITSTITVTVEDMPDESELFESSYYGTLSFTPKGSVDVTFEAATGYGEGYYIATVKTTNTTEYLLCYFDGSTLTSEHYGGAENGFILEFNEAFDIAISHPTIYYDGDTVIYETVNLTRATTAS